MQIEFKMLVSICQTFNFFKKSHFWEISPNSYQFHYQETQGIITHAVMHSCSESCLYKRQM